MGPAPPFLPAGDAAIARDDWIRSKTGVETDFGTFAWDRVNSNSNAIPVAVGHPFGATGARDLSQTVKELWSRPVGSRAMVSACGDGGPGIAAQQRIALVGVLRTGVENLAATSMASIS